MRRAFFCASRGCVAVAASGGDVKHFFRALFLYLTWMGRGCGLVVMSDGSFVPFSYLMWMHRGCGFGTVNASIVLSNCCVLSPGAAVDVAHGGDQTAELAYGNHSSAWYHMELTRDKLVQDVVLGRAVVFERSSTADIRGLRASPVGVVSEPKFMYTWPDVCG